MGETQTWIDHPQSPIAVAVVGRKTYHVIIHVPSAQVSHANEVEVSQRKVTGGDEIAVTSPGVFYRAWLVDGDADATILNRSDYDTFMGEGRDKVLFVPADKDEDDAVEEEA